ncbi:hypothetical protein OL856_02180 [Campylobacter coli]|nr:hypothetical protein [Campylobacter coli]
MYCEIDSKGFDKDKFEKIAKVSQLLGVKIIRSYVPLTDKNKKVKNASDGAMMILKSRPNLTRVNF